jgi:hypothetical protein
MTRFLYQKLQQVTISIYSISIPEATEGNRDKGFISEATESNYD